MSDTNRTDAILAAEAAAIVAVQNFQRAFRRKDLEALGACLHFPFIRLLHGQVEIDPTAAAFREKQELRNRRLDDEGWEGTSTKSLRVVQSSPNKVHVALSNERRRAEGAPYAWVEALWIITRVQGVWGIQCMSIMEHMPD